MDPLKDFLDAVAVAVDRAQVLASSAEAAAEARGPVAEQPTRDPRIDPRAGDVLVLRHMQHAIFVVYVGLGRVWYAGRSRLLTDVTPREWSDLATGARILTPEQGVRGGLYDAP